MVQSELWHDTILDAVGAAVQAAGGIKKVASKLWPALDASSAASKLRSALSPEHSQKLCPEELLLVQRLARDAGDISILEFQARELGCKLEVLAPAEAKKLAKKTRRLALLEELKRLEDE